MQRMGMNVILKGHRLIQIARPVFQHIPNPVETNCRLVAKNLGINDCTVEIRRGSQKGNNFLGDISVVTVKDLDSTKELNLLAKKAMQNPTVRGLYPLTEVYQNEIFVYNVVLPALNEVQENLDDSRKFKGVAKCYYTSMTNGDEMLVLENLQAEGYRMYDKTMLLDGEHMGKIFQTYGKFHALSFALKERNREKYDELKSGLHNMYAKFFDINDNLCFTLKNTMQYIYQRIGRENSKAQGVMLKYSNNVCDICKKLIWDETEFSCILHSDCWSNNILFKYKENDGQRSIQDACLVDWQLARIGSPVFDLSYALYSGASKEVLDDYEKYLHIYHDTLGSVLTDLGCDIEKCYPYRVLDEHWKKYARFGWSLGMIILKMKFTAEQDMLDHADLKISDEKELQDAMANTKSNDTKLMPAVRDILNHMISIDAV